MQADPAVEGQKQMLLDEYILTQLAYYGLPDNDPFLKQLFRDVVEVESFEPCDSNLGILNADQNIKLKNIIFRAKSKYNRSITHICKYYSQIENLARYKELFAALEFSPSSLSFAAFDFLSSHSLLKCESNAELSKQVEKYRKIFK